MKAIEAVLAVLSALIEGSRAAAGRQGQLWAQASFTDFSAGVLNLII